MAGQQFGPEIWEDFGNVDITTTAAAGVEGQADLAAEVLLVAAAVAGLANAAVATASTAVAVVVAAVAVC